VKAAGTVPAAGVPVRAAEFRKKKSLPTSPRAVYPAQAGRPDRVAAIRRSLLSFAAPLMETIAFGAPASGAAFIGATPDRRSLATFRRP